MARLVLIVMLAFGTAAASAQDTSDPVALITSIYKVYTADTQQPPIGGFYSRRLQALIEADEKNTPQGDAGKIDWDVFVDGNNWEIGKLKIAAVAQSATTAQVRAQFDSLGRAHDVSFDLVREDGGWRIDDVRSTLKGGRWTMSKILTGAPDAFPDQKK
jgi:Protein of unknown function (DUF3828)